MLEERSEHAKSTHKSVQYENPARMPDTTCSNCTQFINAEPVRCKTVKLPIHRTGWCKRHVTRLSETQTDHDQERVEREW
jgi:hypothetical protein